MPCAHRRRPGSTKVSTDTVIAGPYLSALVDALLFLSAHFSLARRDVRALARLAGVRHLQDKHGERDASKIDSLEQPKRPGTRTVE
jgi:hypothetical protein